MCWSPANSAAMASMVVAIDQAVHPAVAFGCDLPLGALLACHPVLRRAVLGWQYHFARLQTHALAAFQAFEDAFGLLTPIGDDFGQLFEVGLVHAYGGRQFPQPKIE